MPTVAGRTPKPGRQPRTLLRDTVLSLPNHVMITVSGTVPLSQLVATQFRNSVLRIADNKVSIKY